jgi:hypothetical protein
LAFVANNTDVTFRTMITLTYPAEYPGDGAAVKKHLQRFLKWIKKETNGCQYLWFLEFQDRGAPHIHILITYPVPKYRRHRVLWYARIATRWYQIVDSGDTNHRKAGTRTEALRSPEGGSHYAVKYAYKMRQKKVPEGYQRCGRFWGHSKGVAPKKRESFRMTEDDVRGVLEGWKYEPPDEMPVWRVLFDQAMYFREYHESGIARTPEVEYNGSKTHLPKAPPKDKSKGD